MNEPHYGDIYEDETGTRWMYVAPAAPASYDWDEPYGRFLPMNYDRGYGPGHTYYGKLNDPKLVAIRWWE